MNDNARIIMETYKKKIEEIEGNKTLVHNESLKCQRCVAVNNLTKCTISFKFRPSIRSSVVLCNECISKYESNTLEWTVI